MNLSRLDHVALVCADSTATRDWYVRVLGMEWILQGQWNNNPYFIRKGDSCLALFQAGQATAGPPPAGPRIDHFAFRAETLADYEASKLELERMGIPFDEQDHDVAWSVYMRDPDGHKVEITTYDR